jgi:hypothetical protein
MTGAVSLDVTDQVDGVEEEPLKDWDMWLRKGDKVGRISALNRRGSVLI